MPEEFQRELLNSVVKSPDEEISVDTWVVSVPNILFCCFGILTRVCAECGLSAALYRQNLHQCCTGGLLQDIKCRICIDGKVGINRREKCLKSRENICEIVCAINL